VQKLKSVVKNTLFVTIPFFIVILFVLELFTRLTWDKKQGVPGLVLTHPVRIEVLAPNYKGYYAGQPLKINNLGFRDNQDYSFEKGNNTFRIIVLGDSVTFGHGCKFEETWPFLLKQNLVKWNNKVKWEVWNLGVPGYDSNLELKTLEEIGPKAEPDLVIVGFYENDLIAWDYHPKQKMPGIIYKVKSFLKKKFYLYTKMRFAFNVITNLRVADKTQCEYETQLLSMPDNEIEKTDLSNFRFKHIAQNTPLPPISDRRYSHSKKEAIISLEKDIAQFKNYHAKDVYNVIFFINIAPDIDKKNDCFIDGIHNDMNNFFLSLLNNETKAVSSYNAFWCYKPSEVPGASEHSLAEANLVKADVLFNFLIKNEFNYN